MKIFWFIRVCIAALLSVVLQPAMAGTLSGNLSLPSGNFSLPTDLQVFVRASATSSSPTNALSQLLLTFPQGSAAGASMPFNLTLLDDHDYQLSYSCQTATTEIPCQRIVSRLYFNDAETNNTTYRKANAQVFSGSAQNLNQDFAIETGTMFAGEISLPAGTTLNDDLRLVLLARNVATPSLDLLSIFFTIAQGADSGQYQIRVPDDAAESWHIGYNCSNILEPACTGFVENGYFKPSAPGTTVEDFADAEPLIGDTDRTDVDLSLVDGFSITGSITAPLAVTDPDGLRLRVIARNANDITNNFETAVEIGPGESSAGYELTVSLDPSAAWYVSYSCDVSASPAECDKYLRNGVYDVGGTVEQQADVSAPLAGGESHSGIDLTLLVGVSLSGTVQLSAGEAPAGGLSFSVFAINTAGSGQTFSKVVEIPAGSSATSFAVQVSSNPANVYEIFYDCNEGLTRLCEEVTDRGYFNASTGATVYDENLLFPLMNNGMSIGNIVLVVESPGLLPDEMCFPIVAANGAVAVVCL